MTVLENVRMEKVCRKYRAAHFLYHQVRCQVILSQVGWSIDWVVGVLFKIINIIEIKLNLK